MKEKTNEERKGKIEGSEKESGCGGRNQWDKERKASDADNVVFPPSIVASEGRIRPEAPENNGLR